MEALGLMGFKSHYHISQTLTVTELTKHQSQKLVPAGEMFDILVPIIFASEVVEMIPIKKCYQLREYKLIMKHMQTI